MSDPRPRGSLLPWYCALAIGLLACLTAPTIASAAGDTEVQGLPFQKSLVRQPSADGGSAAVANSNCATCDTVWVGHSNSGPGGAFLGVGVGGVWDFDTGVAGTDSTQGWNRQLMRFHFSAARAVLDRPEWHLDYGNVVNEGNTNLWAARDLAGRKYVKTGIAGVWHSDDMTGLKLNINNGAEPSAVPIAGSRSAWCGLRESGNTKAVDALTGNYINGDLITDFGPVYTSGNEPEFPGYCNQWDQMLYKDVPTAGTGSVAFRVRVAMSTFLDTAVNGSGWYNPDPTSLANYVHQPADSFMVYVGSPTENAYDTNRRWFSEVLDLSKPYQEVFSVSGTFPFTSADTSLTKSFAGLSPVGGNLRVVFRVKTNRSRSDFSTGSATGFNTKDGAATIDNVQVNGGVVYDFETSASIRARSLIGDLGVVGGAWATTGKPVSQYMHIQNVATLVYEDLCGAVGAPTRICNLAGNVLVAGDQDNGNRVAVETWANWESPTVNLFVRSAAPGTKNDQGLDQATAARPSAVIDYDVYTGFMSLDQSVFYFIGAQAYAPGIYVSPVAHAPMWSTVRYPPSITSNDLPQCFHNRSNLSTLGLPVGSLDSLKIMISAQTQGYRFGGTDLGNTRGTYFDNFRLGLVREPAPLISWDIWSKYQDQFPFNEGVSPGDNAAFDTTTALMNTGNNIVTPTTDPGEVAGDSIVVSSPYSGNGTSTGTRVDLVFRIDPGPGNYSVKGDRTSTLVNKDPAHPFFAAYLADNGPFGTPGGHGARWNKNVWNSARMDSAELDGNLFPVLSRAIGIVAEPKWMGTLHEGDPKFATLGILHNVCFLADPNGAINSTNIDCSGTPPAPYGGVSGTTKEGTKIIPDGWLSPGSHVEYFTRRSSIENPTAFFMLPDTNRVFPQDPGGQLRLDAERWFAVNVLPDMWKSSRYNGGGLACMLMVDAADRRGYDPAFRGSADTLGYGKNNGASVGWKGLGPAATSQAQANNPAAFVAANLGQLGLNFDHYDVAGNEGSEAGRLGSRFAQNNGAIALKGDKAGPSAAQLASFYSSILYFCGDLNSNTISDGVDLQEGADDIALLQGFLSGADPSNRRSLWLNGEGIMEDGAEQSDDGTHLYPFLTDVMGSDLANSNYKLYSGAVSRSTIGFSPVAPWAHPGRFYGIDHTCTVFNDLLAVVPTVDGAAEGAQYEHFGSGPFTASVYRPLGASRDFRTVIDGFDLSSLYGQYPNPSTLETTRQTDTARQLWFDDVWVGQFQLCSRKGPVIGVGDLPGSDGRRFSNQNLGSFPNPAFAGRQVTFRFTLAKAQPLTIRVYNVAGREVANFAHKGVEGPNTVLWSGQLANGAKAAPGVYFYSVDGVDFPRDSKAQKLILLGANAAE